MLCCFTVQGGGYWSIAGGGGGCLSTKGFFQETEFSPHMGGMYSTGRGRDVLEGGSRGEGLAGTPSSLGPPMVPTEGGPKNF